MQVVNEFRAFLFHNFASPSATLEFLQFLRIRLNYHEMLVIRNKVNWTFLLLSELKSGFPDQQNELMKILMEFSFRNGSYFRINIVFRLLLISSEQVLSVLYSFVNL